MFCNAMIDRVPLLVQPNFTKDIPFGPLDAMQCITRWSLSFGPAIKAGLSWNQKHNLKYNSIFLIHSWRHRAPSQLRGAQNAPVHMAIVSLALHCSVASVPTQNLFGILFMPEAANVFAQSMDKFGMQPRRSVFRTCIYIVHNPWFYVVFEIANNRQA
jgi:hypothetical protein